MSLLNVDATKRISAFQAGNHPFITMSHLSDPHDIAYLEESVEMMRCCSEVGSEDQQCSEEALEEQQVWEQYEDEDEDGPRNLSGWEEAEPEGWGQPTDHEWEQPSTDDWEQAEDSDWEEPTVSPGPPVDRMGVPHGIGNSVIGDAASRLCSHG
ncbi:unnamed protein product [Tetraodon nigroviridis]|uniref:(spotted green pufferfish) hypothetical protein n=1 Tax=Tetraodon nigroviridis TaxID=99883 RepID=Q4THY6_TETNG|nr:unnamed protein product [Tetraodon nigroviridis]